jgi:phage shock protein PspC (stress-responsive transcriptional regulator)
MTTQRQALRRSKQNRVIAGVCGGLAEFFGVSSFWFRLAFLIALIPWRRTGHTRLSRYNDDRPV